MIELLVVLLVLGAGMIVFYPVLAGRDYRVPGPTRAARSKPLDPQAEEQLTELRERKRRLLRNLQELEAERAAGRIADPDYTALRDRDTAEAARVIQQLEKVEAELKAGRRSSKKPVVTETAAVPPRQRIARAAAWVGGVVVFGALLVFTMSRAITPREPGGTITGTIPGGPGSGGGPPGIMPAANPARLAELERALRRDSTNLKALLEAGHLYLAEQRFDEAMRVTVRALSIDPKAAEGYAHVGVLLFAESGSHDDPDSARTALDAALKAVNYALELKPDLPEGWLFKGMIYMAGLQDPGAAAAAWERYLQVAPKDADTTRIAAIVRGLKSR